MTTTIHFVPHTHWDREWYEPFQVFRMRLVDLVDHVLDHLEREPAFRFTLDGQLATIDDYLEVRPGSEERIRRFVAEGRLALGPWQILLDEFLVSGETIVRNLARGWRRAHDFGSPMNVGYLPDMFGHIAQMPQILAGAGIERAVVWRGVPASVERNRFLWRAPDGSEVDAEYLVGGYGNAAYLLEVPGGAEAKVRGYREVMGGWYGDESLLAMYGTDHMAPLPEMVALLEEINASQSEVRVSIETLADYIAATTDGVDRASLTLVEGELRSGARANMLMGVTSAHVDIRAAAARAERWLSRYAEPLGALHGRAWPERLLELAWGKVIDCSAHDSICGCSVDPVAAQVLVRLGEAEQIARELTARTAVQVASSLPRGSWLWLNPTPRPRAGLVELDVMTADDDADIALELDDGRLVATQEVSRNEPLLFEAEVEAAEVGQFLHRRMHGRELFGRQLNRATIEDGVITLWLDHEPDPEWLDVDQLRHEIAAAAESGGRARWTLRVISAPRRTIRAMVPAPALGWGSARPVAGTGAVEHAVRATPDSLDNGLVSVSVAADGTLTLHRGGMTVSGLGRLVDGGDAGDSYNYGPPARDAFVDQPLAVKTALLAAGPVAGELLVSRKYAWPAGLAEDRRARSTQTVETRVDMRVELRAGESLVRVRLDLDNQAEDHRLRVHLPLPVQTDRSFAEGQYAVVERGLECEAGHGEVPLATFPAYGFVAAGGLAVLLEHVTEYELLDGRELALTALRSIGWISRNDNPYREDPAGPEKHIPAAQMRGRQSLSFGLLLHEGDWHAAGVSEAAEAYQHDLIAARGTLRSGEAAAAAWDGPGLEVSGAGVALTALYRRDDWLELRVVAQTPAATTARIGPGVSAARAADLLGRSGDELPVEGGWLTLALDQWQIRTVQLRR